MVEVYRARSPGRFQRHAEVLASLKRQNIAAIYRREAAGSLASV
jgi:hypothetical protein